MLFKKSYQQLMDNAVARLVENTEITNLSIGSVARSLLEIINNELSTYYETLDLNMAMGFVSTAEGYFLDLIGELLNVTRLEETHATASEIDKNIRFYVLSGFLSDVLTENRIPAGVQISTADGEIVYVVAADTLFTGGVDTEVFVSVTADTAGEPANVGKNKLIVHNMGIDSLFVANNNAIVGGTNTESDSNFKYRITQAVTAAEKANEVAVRLAVLTLPGVADLKIIRYARGIGSFDLIVIPLEGIASDTLIAQAQIVIDETQAVGISGRATKPDIIPVDLEVLVVFDETVTDIEAEKLRNDIQAAIEHYIVNIGIGATFIYKKFVAVIMGTSGKIKTFETVHYFFRNSPHLLADVVAYPNELFFPNTLREDPIRVIS